MARELHQSSSSSLLDKEPLNDIPEDNEEACTTPSEDRVLATPRLTDSITIVPAIQIEVTCDDSEFIHRTSLTTIPEIQIMSDEASDNDTANEKGMPRSEKHQWDKILADCQSFLPEIFNIH